jgi:hypothetical protein
MNFQTQCGKRLHLGIRRDSFFIFVALELASNQMLWVQRWNGAEYFDLFIADSVAMQPSGGGPWPEKDSRFRKNRMKCTIQLLCGSKVVSKRLLDNDSRILDATRFCERFDD